MASSIEFRDYILGQLSELNNITYRSMMGEFLLYYNGVLFGGIYDNRLLIKMTNSNAKFNLYTELPYENAKAMYMVENVDDREYLNGLIKDTCKDLE